MIAPAFDAASVKPRRSDSKPGADRRMRVSPEGITYTDITLSAAIQKTAVEILVIDHAEKVPTKN